MTEDEIRARLSQLLNDAFPDAPFYYELDFTHLAANSLELVELLCANRRLEASKVRRSE